MYQKYITFQRKRVGGCVFDNCLITFFVFLNPDKMMTEMRTICFLIIHKTESIFSKRDQVPDNNDFLADIIIIIIIIIFV